MNTHGSDAGTYVSESFGAALGMIFQLYDAALSAVLLKGPPAYIAPDKSNTQRMPTIKRENLLY